MVVCFSVHALRLLSVNREWVSVFDSNCTHALVCAIDWASWHNCFVLTAAALQRQWLAALVGHLLAWLMCQWLAWQGCQWLTPCMDRNAPLEYT